jgi:hypothetical protein
MLQNSTDLYFQIKEPSGAEYKTGKLRHLMRHRRLSMKSPNSIMMPLIIATPGKWGTVKA